jgi:2-haloacid dehalogenase
MKRRTFLSLATAESLVFSGSVARARTMPGIKAIAFDGFTIFDPRPISALAEELFPGKGLEFSNIWRSRQFEYTWLRTLTGAYADFWHVTEDALVFAAKLVKLDLTKEKHQLLTQAFLEFRAWSDAPAALKHLKESGIKMVFLSNFTEAMLDAAVRSCRLQGIFEPHLSTDMVRAYKPDARAYQMAVDALKLQREEIVFAASAGWDAAGAKAFGFPTFWVNRMHLPVEELGFAPDAIGASMHDLVTFAIGNDARR